MRKIIFALLTIVSVSSFVACSSDDDKGPNCEKLAQNFANALEAYMADPSDENEAKLDAASTALENSNCAEFEVEM